MSLEDRTILDHLRGHLIAAGIVRAPNQAGPAARPWLPPCWRHEDDGPLGPGDAASADRAPDTHDDGLVANLRFAPAVSMAPGEEERRRYVVDVVLRGTAVPAIAALEGQIRRAILDDPPPPGGQCDWVMDGLYIIQAVEYKPWQPLEAGTARGKFAFLVGYLFEVRAE